MSEYQYYEFQAIDRPLTGKEMRRLRSFSTRARISPTSFVNDYAWGDLKGDPDAWMEQYFDAFVYFANWGTRTLKLRLPSRPSPSRQKASSPCVPTAKITFTWCLGQGKYIPRPRRPGFTPRDHSARRSKSCCRTGTTCSV